MTSNSLYNSCTNIQNCLSGIKFLLDHEVLSTRVKVDWESYELGEVFYGKIFRLLFNYFTKKYPKVGWQLERRSKYDSHLRNAQYIPTWKITTDKYFGAVKEDFNFMYAQYYLNPETFKGNDMNEGLFNASDLEDLKEIISSVGASITELYLVVDKIENEYIEYYLPPIKNFSQIKDMYYILNTFSKLYYNVNFMSDK